MRCKADCVRAILTNTHAHKEESEQFKAMLAFKVETETAGDFFNGSCRPSMERRNSPVGRNGSDEVQLRRVRGQAFDATQRPKRGV